MSANISPESTPLVGEDQTANRQVNGADESIMNPDLLFKLNKKIAQLTKVVYGLNTRGEELESQLMTSKENEEKARNMNGELQCRVNNFKAKIEAEMGKLKELETQATQAQYWKREFENLKRRFEVDQLPTNNGQCLLDFSEQLEEHQRREEALQYELEKSNHTVNNLKVHHDFIMKERDTQTKLEREKIVLEWQSRITDIEGRYKSQLRRAAEEIKVMADECSNLRIRITNVDESGLREKIKTMQLTFDKEKKDFLREIRQKSEEMELERGEIIELQRKLHIINEEKRKIEEKRDEELSEALSKYEAKVTDLQNKYEILQELDDSREQEFELKLKSKLQEWRSDRNAVEEGYRTEFKNLRIENDQIVSELKTIRSSANKTGTDFSKRVEELERELAEKSREVEIKGKNFKVRINMLETKNTQLIQERLEFQCKLETETERFKQMSRTQDALHEQVVYDLQERINHFEETEKNLREFIKSLEERTKDDKKVFAELQIKIRDVEREGEIKYEREKGKIEAKVKQKVERIWTERLQTAEDFSIEELSKSKEEWKKKEETLRNEVAKAEMMKDEAKKGSEELRKKIRELRQQELDSGKKQNLIETQFNSLKRQEEVNSRKLKEVESQTNRYQQQIDQLTVKLTQEQQLVFQLRQDLSDSQTSTGNLKQDLEESKKKNSVTTSLEIKIQELSRQIREKEAATESVRVDLQYEKNELDNCKSKIRRLEDDLSQSAKTIQKLEKQLTSRSQDSSKAGDFEAKIKMLEDKLLQSESTRRNLEASMEEIEEEREDEMKIVQDALDEAAQEREELIKTFQKELDNANSMNTDREQQMLDDFEWKLREMQKENKKTLDDMENQAEERLNTVRSVVESELSESLMQVAEDRKIADQKLNEVLHLKSHQVELIQLRGVVEEFQKGIRATAREIERMKIRQILYEEEIKSYKSGAQSRQNTLHKRKYSEDDEYRIKLEKVKKEINSEWEDKLRQESARLKVCLESKYDQEQETALDDLRNQYENEHKNFNKSYEIKEKEMSEEMLNLRKLLSEKESNHQKEVEDLRTNSDRDIWELRMKLQKMNDSSYDKEQKLIEKHSEELERLRIDYDERIKEMNTRIEDYELRIGVDTIDKLNKDHRKQIEHLGEQHRLSMERLREESEGDKFQSVEEARLALTNNYEQLSVSLREKLTEADIQISQYKMELQNALDLANKRKDTIQNYEEQIEQLKQIQSLGASIPMTSSSSGIISQYSLETQSFNGSQDSQNSQDTGSCSDSGHEDNHKNGGGSLLGKVFGGGWFQPHKSRRGSTSLTNKKTY